ncbi:MAG: alpha/beta hydrolase [Candidatus Marinimicrobia bacterium]|nr:alpha/beta hydrolase [Candidatus Neomarinimicrobiota bacterium]MCF7850888.1 alpha/beta hydrolase [Candidatus Neomarinimicrobiota bacterium]MCF7904159.1 alpha/beta hydrolase [Candidatus Neomarinimicrobiota bacterium]
MRRRKLIRRSTILIALIVLSACAGNGIEEKAITSQSLKTSNQWPAQNLDHLAEGSEIKVSGLQLMEQPLGLVELTTDAGRNDSVLIVAVHGYQSSGYEWITGLKHLGAHYGSLYFYRYDWNRCPESIAEELASLILNEKQTAPYKRVILFGHSYGGVVVAQAASQIGAVRADVHVIAAPLAGFQGLTDNCDELQYDEWSKSVNVLQHRTVKAQDGAFRELEDDPQEIDLPFHEVYTLPPTMDGHRLGHNWSVTWVLDQHVGRAHRL